jgi:hypothetical protein
VTTVAGLLPLLLETSFQAQFLIPKAVSISFGLIAATGLTLVFVPALYVVIVDMVGIFMATGDTRDDTGKETALEMNAPDNTMEKTMEKG